MLKDAGFDKVIGEDRTEQVQISPFCWLFKLFLLRIMIFILNLNPTSLSFQDSWLFNMISKFGLTRGFGLSHLFAI